MDPEFRTLATFKTLIQWYGNSNAGLDHLTMSRMDLVREIRCADKKDRKVLQEEILKVDALIHHLYPNGI